MRGPAAPIDAAEVHEALRSGGFEAVQVTFQDGLSPASIQVDQQLYAGFVQHVEQLGYGPAVPTTPELFAQVVVSVDRRKARPATSVRGTERQARGSN